MSTMLDINAEQKTSYCVPLWVRDQNIEHAIGRVKDRLRPATSKRLAPIAVVCFGPSLNQTWEQLRDFEYLISCSGSHQFLIDRGIIPTWHVDVDPRKHKATLLGTPHKDVEYLIASTCHKALFDLLEGYTVKLWHIFDSQAEALRVLPRGEWALTGGSSAGLRAMGIAQFLGFTDLHIFGMDGSSGPSGRHAAAHPNQAPTSQTTEYKGVVYETTPAFLACAKQTFHELDQMPDVHATFYGEGLVQAMAKDYTPKKIKKSKAMPAYVKDPVISEEYRSLNRQLHIDNGAYGVGSMKHVDMVKKLAAATKATSILDYGCGKGMLAKALEIPIWEYDPAIPGKEAEGKPADLVVCTDVLEHVEPDKLSAVLVDLARCVKQVGYFIIHTGPAKKTYANGQNTHLIQEGRAWWEAALATTLTVAKISEVGQELHVIVAPKKKGLAGVLPPPTPAFSNLLSLARAEFRRLPYAIGVVKGALEPTLYQSLVETFPSIDLFADVSSAGGNQKRSLSEVNHRQQYLAFLQTSPPWQRFHAWVKHPGFIDATFDALAVHGVLARTPKVKYSARFEFSALPADGGCLRPHTDLRSKVVTIVLAMRESDPRLDRWDSGWDGGTAVLAPKEGRTPEDYKADLDQFDWCECYPYLANQAVVFVKAANSWHAVGPMTGVGSGEWRKTVTINIERVP